MKEALKKAKASYKRYKDILDIGEATERQQTRYWDVEEMVGQLEDVIRCSNELIKMDER